MDTTCTAKEKAEKLLKAKAKKARDGGRGGSSKAHYDAELIRLTNAFLKEEK